MFNWVIKTPFRVIEYIKKDFVCQGKKRKLCKASVTVGGPILRDGVVSPEKA
jgi:hypothetical protein